MKKAILFIIFGLLPGFLYVGCAKRHPPPSPPVLEPSPQPADSLTTEPPDDEPGKGGTVTTTNN